VSPRQATSVSETLVPRVDWQAPTRRARCVGPWEPGITHTVRRTRGLEADAACGQLTGSFKRKEKPTRTTEERKLTMTKEEWDTVYKSKSA
jgi:hypothetical protein